MKKTQSEFLHWFIAQHGKRPSKLSIWRLRVIRNEHKAKAEAASRLLAKTELWEANKTSALYAWNAARGPA